MIWVAAVVLVVDVTEESLAELIRTKKISPELRKYSLRSGFREFQGVLSRID